MPNFLKNIHLILFQILFKNSKKSCQTTEEDDKNALSRLVSTFNPLEQRKAMTWHQKFFSLFFTAVVLNQPNQGRLPHWSKRD